MNNEDVLQRNDAGELEIRTAPSTGDTGTNKDDVYTRDEQGRLCVRTTGGGGGGGTGTVTSVNGVQPVDGNVKITGDNITATVGEEEATITQHLTTLKDDESGLAEQVLGLQQSINGKQDALTTEQLAAVNSGITSAKVASYDAYADEISTAQSTADKADGAAEVAQQTANLAGQNAAQALEDLKSKANTTDLPQNQTGTAGQVYTKTESGAAWQSISAGGLPDQTNNKGRLLFTDGTNASWSEFFKFEYIESGNQVGACIAGFLSNIVDVDYRGLILGVVADLGGNDTILVGAASNIVNKNTQITTKGAYNTFVGVANGGDVINKLNVVVKAPLNSINIQSARTAFFGIDGGFTLNDPSSIYMGTEYNQPYKILDGLTGLIPAERLPQTNYGLNISDTFTQAVNNAETYNLITTVDLSTDVTLAANMESSNYSVADGALKLPTNAGYVDYGIEVRLSGSFAGGENTNREFSVQLQRADGTVISEKAIVKVSGNDLSKRGVVFETFTNTATDPFIASGLKLVINNTSGQTLNLTGCDILIKARA